MPDKTEIAAEETTTTPQPDLVPSESLEDIRARIRRRAEELNLEANDKPAAEVYDKAQPKGFLQDALDTAAEKAETEALAEEAWDDGLGLLEGAFKELENIEWPTLMETAGNTLWVVGLTIFMIGYVFFIDAASKFVLKDKLMSVGIDITQNPDGRSLKNAPKQLEGTPLAEEKEPQGCLFNPGGCKKE